MGRHWWRWVLGGTILLVVAVGALAVMRVARTADELREARDLIDQAGVRIEAGELAAARDDLQAASGLLLAANTTLRTNPEIDLASNLPVLGENIRSLRASVSLAYRLVAGGETILRIASPLQDAEGKLQVPLETGRLPLDTLADTEIQLQVLARSLSTTLEAPSHRHLVDSVAEVQDRVFEEATERRRQLIEVSQALALIREMAGGNGDRRYLIAVANTAEMRATGGMILSYGVLEGSDGDFELRAFGPIDQIFLETTPREAVAPLYDDERERWAGLEPTRLWRNANLLPDIQLVGPRMAAMYQAASGLPVDGVIQIDAHGLAAILAGVGPVVVDPIGTVNAENVVDVTLNQVYFTFGDDQAQRREVLGDVAEATFRRLVDGDYPSLRPLGEALFEAAAQRHVVVWSGRSSAADPLAFFDVDGELPSPDVGDSFLLTVQNFGRDKLDYYLDTAVRVTGSRPVGETSELDVEVTVSSAAPAGTVEPAYVFGTDVPRGGVPPGTYVGIASLYVPNGTVLVDAAGGPGSPRLVVEAGRSAVTWDLTVDPQSSASVSFRLALPPRPPEPYAIALTPVPRVRPTTWTFDVSVGDREAVRRDGPLVVPELLVPSRSSGDPA